MDSLVKSIDSIISNRGGKIERDKSMAKIYSNDQLIFRLYENVNNNGTYFLLDVNGMSQASPLMDFLIIDFFRSLYK